ncbi:MAG: NAD-dependent epimerase/dehydratase family protein [Clostridia bacterium]
MNNVMITGATGFIGSHITRIFCENRIKVGCLVRENSNLENIQGLSVDLHYGDILNTESLKKAFEGYQCIIHNAAKAVDWGAYEDFYNTNVNGTLNILKTAIKTGIKNIIITGSNSVYGEENSFVIKDESSPCNSHYKYFADRFLPCALNYYRDTKALAKKEAMAFAKENGLNLTIIEPVWVYGEREFNTGFYEYIKTASTGIPLLPGSKKNKFHVVYAGDLARAYLLVFKKQLKGVECILIGNQRAESMDKIYTLFCHQAGIKKPLNIPKSIIDPAALTMELLYTLFHSKKPPLLTRGRVNMFYDNIEFSVKKAEQLLGFKNEYTLEEGIKKTVQWYKENGFL